jgi:repressor LexA
MNDSLTPRQRCIRDYMANCYLETGLPPTVAEIVERFGFKSQNAAMCHLKPLIRKGAVRVGKDKGGSHRYLPAGYVVVSEAELARLRGGL